MSLGASVRDNIILKTLVEELVGPCAYGEEIDILNSPVIKAEQNTTFVKKNDKEEIIKVFPTQRYGVGVIYPQDFSEDFIACKEPALTSQEDEVESEYELPQINNIKNTKDFEQSVTDDSNDFDIALANSRAPSSMGISFLLDPNYADEIEFELTGAFYTDFKISIQRESKSVQETWWYRKPIHISFKKKISELRNFFKFNVLKECNDSDTLLDCFYIEGVIRKHEEKLLITAAIVNRHTVQNDTFVDRNKKCIFQTQLKVNLPSNCLPAIIPYPELENTYLSQDELSNQLLYRNAPVFARGHGVASNWNSSPYSEVKAVTSVYTESLPTFETPSISAEVEISKNNSLVISMESLSNFEIGGEGDKQIKALIDAYSDWIIKKSNDIDQLDLKLHETAKNHIKSCQEALKRINEGYSLIKTNLKVQRAFQLANKAMLNQQRHAPKSIREVEFDENGHPYVKKPFAENSSAKGIWRPFQIGFLLMCIQGAVDNTHVDHEKVDLIWFPTGGGKTEAYLGLAAFTLIFNRLEKGSEADGVQVLMRYTLRLLTAQQLQRAATLICCLEVIRREENIQGKQFSIGLWVGGENTPNKRNQAITALKELNLNLKKNKETNNPFLIDRCPYCSTQLGIVGSNKFKTVVGYKENRQLKSVMFSCIDMNCPFYKQIPVFVVDEDIYDERPSIVIGTVDKFAMLAWQPKIRSIFGLGDDGKRCALPPQLIIQDELHLISGPLGSMVALYEPLIEKLCSENLNGIIRKPKIICATATTKGYREQIDGIYGRKDVSIFPPLGLEADDSFFAKYARDVEGKLLHGRKYVGVCAPGLKSILTTQVRTQSALLFAANRVDIEQRDPWVTLLSFYNSIRELGGAITLFQSDIVGYLLEQKRRYPRSILPRRIYPDQGMELTSRLKDDEIPKSIVALEERLDAYEPNLKNIYKNIGNELKDLGIKYPEISEYTSTLNQRIEKFNRLELDDYYFLENIKMFLSKKSPQLRLPKHCRSLYELCINYNVKAFCLASSIIEVGVDIDRLSVMSIIGQPKTTAQYIQVSGRVGRKADERPGLVVTIYNNSKPRDKSHYEDFRGYHQRLYAKVEPSSVTPFSRPAVKRGMSAITVANMRQTSPVNVKPNDIDTSVIERWITELFKLRGNSMTEDEKTYLSSFLNKFLHRWDKVKTTYNEWGQLKLDSEPAQQDLLLPLGTPRNAKAKILCPTSMRNVDGESALWITGVYDQFEEEDDEDE